MRFIVLASFVSAVVFVNARQEPIVNRPDPKPCKIGESIIEDCQRCWCLNSGWICELKPIESCVIENHCEPGSTWKAQCNDCTCGPNGKTESCTRKGCILRWKLPQNFVNTSQRVPEQSHPNSSANITRLPHQPDQLNNSYEVFQKQDPSVVSNNSHQVPELSITPIWNNPQETPQEPPEQLDVSLVWKTFQGTPHQSHSSFESNNSHEETQQTSSAVDLNKSHELLQRPDRIIDKNRLHERPQRPHGYPAQPSWNSNGNRPQKPPQQIWPVDTAAREAIISSLDAFREEPYLHWPAEDRPCVPGENFDEECNTCTCGPDGMSATCTRKSCRPTRW